jgi:hypothetical protein
LDGGREDKTKVAGYVDERHDGEHLAGRELIAGKLQKHAHAHAEAGVPPNVETAALWLFFLKIK